jgi:putative ABC transport system ATP-binding protein
MLIQINNLSKTYGNKETLVKALNGINLSVNKGEFVTLVGPSGCGKSTLLHILGAMDSPDEGEILLEGSSLQKLKNRQLTNLRLKRIGFIFQTYNLIPTLPALENVMLPMKLSGISRRIAREKSIILLEKMGLKDRLKHVPSQLSGGQKQRVAIARALANDPAIILADEPTGNLDSVSGEIIMNLLYSLNKDGNTIIMVTHNTELAGRVGRVVSMKDGQLVQAG